MKSAKGLPMDVVDGEVLTQMTVTISDGAGVPMTQG